MRVGVVVIAYETAPTVAALLDRIPHSVMGTEVHVLVSDDASTDDTAGAAQRWADRNPDRSCEVVRQPVNLGYGGNQKACYRWAIETALDAVVLLHGDGQYPPELIEELVGPVARGDAEMVLGSRMLIPRGATRGGMPWRRLVGNRTLSLVLNRLSGARLSEWFSGFRAYSVASLRRVGLDELTNGFDFDIAITAALLADGARIIEVPIPTRYSGEISRVPLVRTGLASVAHGFRLHRLRRQAPTV